MFPTRNIPPNHFQHLPFYRRTPYPAPIPNEIPTHLRLAVLAHYSKSKPVREIARITGLAESTVRNIVAVASAGQLEQWDTSSPKPYAQLSDEARKAWDDFAYFQRRYFGRIPTPWQAHAAAQVTELEADPEKSYAVINVAPGSGKSLFAHDLSAWLTVRNRALRGLQGSASARLAEKYTARLRRTLEATHVLRADEALAAKGLALDADACLVDDFGRFRPIGGSDFWRANEFVVEQLGGTPITSKETTWAAYGRDSASVGNRFGVVIWDDLVTKAIMSSAQAIEDQREWWTDEAERRLDPGGLFLTIGQRFGPEDLYRFCLDMPIDIAGLDDDAIEVLDYDKLPRKYTHIVYRAHYDELCTGERHKISQPYYDPADPRPGACLLDPRRLTWAELSGVRLHKPRTYEVVFQQRDVDPKSQLVRQVWVSGGNDPVTGETHPGCWDDDRGTASLPRSVDGRFALAGPLISFCAVDPAPVKYWAIEWFVHDVASDQVFLMDIFRDHLEANQFLDQMRDGTFVGIAEDWQQRSMMLGLPITHWIVERNAAQRWLYNYRHTSDWTRMRRTAILSHETLRNKLDPTYGIGQLVPSVFRYGRLRLPGLALDPGRSGAQGLVDEALHYPEAMTDDRLMALWMGLFHLPDLIRDVVETKPIRFARPSWLVPAH